MKPIIVDTGVSNTFSVEKVLRHLGYDYGVAGSYKDLENASKIILPGVGSFKNTMASLVQLGFKDEIKELVSKYQVPVLGICLGMQLLLQSGDEGGKSEGLGLIEGRVEKLPSGPETRIPHIGWNTISVRKHSEIFHSIPDELDCYFVHSYHAVVNNNNIISETQFGTESFASGIQNNLVFGLQFHPEKSSKKGIEMIKNFLEIG